MTCVCLLSQYAYYHYNVEFELWVFIETYITIVLSLCMTTKAISCRVGITSFTNIQIATF